MSPFLMEEGGRALVEHAHLGRELAIEERAGHGGRWQLLRGKEHVVVWRGNGPSGRGKEGDGRRSSEKVPGRREQHRKTSTRLIFFIEAEGRSPESAQSECSRENLPFQTRHPPRLPPGGKSSSASNSPFPLLLGSFKPRHPLLSACRLPNPSPWPLSSSLKFNL